MGRRIQKRKCQHCKAFFYPDHRNVGRQRYCSQPPCQKASKVASQRRWLNKPENRNHFKGPDHVQRVRQWRQANPGYWRRKGSQAPDALQDSLTPKAIQKQQLEGGFVEGALQDSFLMQPAVFVGLIAHLTGHALQDDIAITLRKWQQLGHDILSTSAAQKGGIQDAQTPHLQGQTPTSAEPIQLARSAPGA